MNESSGFLSICVALHFGCFVGVDFSVFLYKTLIKIPSLAGGLTAENMSFPPQ